MSELRPDRDTRTQPLQHIGPLPRAIGRTYEYTFPLPKPQNAGRWPQPLIEEGAFQQTFELTKPKPKKATKPNLRKPNAENPGVPTKTVEERIESRREYDRARSQTEERKKFDRLYKQKVRQERKAAGLCKTCPNPAIPGQTRCESCRDKHNRNR